MRIIAGKFKGKPLRGPDDLSIRPTSDRVKESIFNILASLLGPNFEGVRVLDLFAGTGAMGLEAMSRGAEYAIFVDMGPEARGLIREHVELLGVAGVTRLLRRDATDLGPSGNVPPFDLVFCDPPYGEGLSEKALQAAHAGDWLAKNATIIVEEKRGVDFNPGDQFTIDDQRTYGGSTIYILNYVGAGT